MSVKLEKGMLIKTNYSGPYRILDIERGCTCSSYLDELNMDDPPQQPKHMHLVLTRPDGTGRFWLNYFIEETMESIGPTICGGEWGHDRIIALDQDKPVQMELF